MDKFLLILVFWLVSAIVSFFYFGGKKFVVIKGGKADNWSETKKKKFSMIVRSFFRVLAITLLIFNIVPMLGDLPALTKENFRYIEGRPSIVKKPNHSSGYFKQDLVVNGVELSLYLNSIPIFKSKKYRFTYLPTSHFVINTEVLE